MNGPSSIPAPKALGLALDKPINVFAAVSKKNVFGASKKSAGNAPPKPMSEAERIMKEELERKRLREVSEGRNSKKRRAS
jgi:DNA/RNA-binding protein KIN17